jgi:GT2 family glycosyltransferase
MIGIVTVVTNEKYNLEGFYNSLKKQTYKDFKLYLVDNNSTDGSSVFFDELNSGNSIKAEKINLTSNYGFSGGSNIGAGRAINDGCRYLFISNNDLILEENCLAELLNTIESEQDIACAGPVLLMHNMKNPDIIQEFGGKINFKTGSLKKFYHNENIKNAKLPEKMETDFIGGGVCFIKGDLFKKIGMLETAYFGYFDEIDLSYRIKVLNNYKMYVTSKAIAWHNHYSTEKNKKSYYFEYYLSERNKFLYYYKYRLYFSIFRAILTDSVKFPVRLRWFMKVCDFKLGMYYLKGMLDGILKKKGKPNFSR